MRLLITILAIAVLAIIAEWFGPWWSAALAAGIVGIFARLRTGEAFLAGFLGIALLWLGFFLIKDFSNHHILSQRMAGVFHLPNYLFYLITTFLTGGIAGGLSAWAGAHLRKMFIPVKAEMSIER